MTTTKQLESSCRICLETSPNMQPVSTKTADMLMMLTNLTEINMFPSNVCELCQSTLTTAYLFKKLCLETERVLSELIAEPIPEFVSVPNILPDNIMKTPLISDIKTEINVENHPSTIQLRKDDVNATHKVKRKPISRKNSVRCTQCEIYFTTNTEYRTHYATVHLEKSQDYVCTDCGQRFTLPENLKAHMRIHSGEKRYECPECGMKFMHWHNKNNHIQRIHKKEKLRCNICNKLFSTQTNLARHNRVHRGYFPHKCLHCPKQFTTSTQLRKHLNGHVKQESFQ